MKNEAVQYSQKYKEASDVLAIRNTKKTSLKKEKKELEKEKKKLERQVEVLLQTKEDLEVKVS